MICQPCSTAGDLLTDQITHDSEHFNIEWLLKANEYFVDPTDPEKNIPVEAVLIWLHEQCPGTTKDKTWCDCQHGLESALQKEPVSDTTE